MDTRPTYEGHLEQIRLMSIGALNEVRNNVEILRFNWSVWVPAEYDETAYLEWAAQQ